MAERESLKRRKSEWKEEKGWKECIASETGSGRNEWVTDRPDLDPECACFDAFPSHFLLPFSFLFLSFLLKWPTHCRACVCVACFSLPSFSLSISLPSTLFLCIRLLNFQNRTISCIWLPSSLWLSFQLYHSLSSLDQLSWFQTPSLTFSSQFLILQFDSIHNFVLIIRWLISNCPVQISISFRSCRALKFFITSLDFTRIVVDCRQWTNFAQAVSKGNSFRRQRTSLMM